MLNLKVETKKIIKKIYSPSYSLFLKINKLRFKRAVKKEEIELRDINEIYSVFYFKELKLSYNQIKKSGNSNIFILIQSILLDNDYPTPSKFGELKEYIPAKMIKKFRVIGRTRINRQSVNSIMNSFKFTFVRNPYVRAVSMFRDRILKEKFVTTELDNITDDKIGFLRFVEYLEHGGLQKDSHFKSQTNHLFFKIKDFDFIGKLEAFEKDFNSVIRYNNMQISENTKRIINNRQNTRHVTNSSTHYQKYYDNFIAEKVYNLYKDDFSNFSYSKEYFDE